MFIGAARKREEVLDHVLVYGPPGLGKTTLAHILGNEMGVGVHVTSGPIIEKAADLAGLLTNLNERDVLFIDEIHRLPKTVEEYLFSAMEDFCIDIMIDQGPNARSVRLNIPRFTLLGATTRSGLLTAPLRSRFTLQTRLDYYNKEIATTINIFENFDNIKYARIGNAQTNESAMQYCTRLAEDNGWSPNLDMSVEYNQMLDATYNPNLLNDRASKCYEMMRLRNQILTDFYGKLDKIYEIFIDDNKSEFYYYFNDADGKWDYEIK